MFKLALVLFVVLAVPITSHSFDYGFWKRYAVEMYYREESFNERCKNISGVNIDKTGKEHLYEEYNKCANDARLKTYYDHDLRIVGRIFDLDQNLEFTFSDLERSMLVFFVQKHCPNQKTYLNCDDILSPIYKACYTDDERANKTFMEYNVLRVIDFFCDKDGEGVVNFINGKVLECVFSKRDELTKCLTEFTRQTNTQISGRNLEIAEADVVCNSIETFRNCAITHLEQCELSRNASTLMNSVFAYVQSGSTCANVNNFISPQTRW